MDDILLYKKACMPLHFEVENATEWARNILYLSLRSQEYLECGLQIDGNIQIHTQALTKVTQPKYLGPLVLDGKTEISQCSIGELQIGH